MFVYNWGGEKFSIFFFAGNFLEAREKKNANESIQDI